MMTLLTILASALGGAVLVLVGVVVWQARRPGPVGPPETSDPHEQRPRVDNAPGLDEPTNPDPPPRVDYLEEALRDPPEPVPDDPDDPDADERRADRARAVLDEWDRLRGRLDE